MRIPVRSFPALVLALFAMPFSALAAQAWNAPPAGVIAIAEAHERAEEGDFLVIEGVVTERRGQKLFRLQDASGEMWVLIPDYLLRDEGIPEQSERIRVAGKYDHKKLDASVEGVRVLTLWRGEQVTGGRGAPARSPEKSASAPAKRPATSPPPAAAAQGAAPSAADASSASVIRPSAEPEMVAKLAGARREWLDALAELEEASTAYGQALYKAGDAGLVKREITARNEAAEQRVARASAAIPPLVEEARRAGVSEETLRLYVQMTTRGE